MPEDNDITAQIAVQPQDLYDPLIYSWGNLCRWVLALFLSYLLYATSEAWAPDGSNLAPASGVVALLFSITLVLLIVFLYPYLRIRSIFHESPTLGKLRIVSFNSDGMRIVSDDARGEYKWGVFRNIIETRKAFLFAQSNRSTGAVYVPKRCLSGPEEVASLRRLIRANFAGRARLQSN